MRYFLWCILVFAICVFARGQQTIGLFQNEPDAYNGYTLFAPTSYNVTYLIDNCGHLVHSWESNFLPGHAVYLLEDGDLLRTARIPSSFNGGGSGGRIERITWDGTLTWSFNYSSAEVHQHHDIEPMPNGNILILAWIRKSQQEAVAAGRNPATVSLNGLWSEHIIEITPLGQGDTAIVWEWHAWDHLVQDFDTTKANYGAPADNPGRININRVGDGSLTDWLHCNSIDYNPELDQIMLSSRNFNELWIIDHSTTSGEAAVDTGGTSGRGGELLYRWGNPAAYNHGTEEDQVFFGQHDAHWISPGLPDAGKIMVFNNGPGRPDGNYSSVDIIQPPLLPDSTYAYTAGIPFGPDSLYWSYTGAPSNSFFSLRVSGASQLPNGNTLICDGSHGVFHEINAEQEKVWEYHNPVGVSGPMVQGSTSGVSDVFRIYRYGPEFPAFEGRDLTPGPPIELEPVDTGCMIVSTNEYPAREETVILYPNPSYGDFNIEIHGSPQAAVSICTPQGMLVFQDRTSTDRRNISTKGWLPGVYLVYISLPKGQRHIIRKLIVL